MATLLLSTIGTAVAGPIGGAVGGFLGRQIDQNILFKPKTREGPRLTDLAVQTSQYGRQVPRLYGRMRVAGSVIWATELQESSRKQGGGKGQPSTRTYSYSVSFAVALSSRPVATIGRIWAEGNLLRGARGDFKTPVAFRFYDGHGDQMPDALLASAEGLDKTPAHRGLAYAVFEDMQLADYGNRIPSLTFEVIADTGAVTLHDIAGDQVRLAADSALPQQFAGFAASGSDTGGVLTAIDAALPLTCAAAPDGVRLTQKGLAAEDIAEIGKGDIVQAGGDSAHAGGIERARTPLRGVPDDLALRYYDAARDYQAGLRHARHGLSGQSSEEIDLPAVLAADAAQAMADRLYRTRRAARHSLTLTCAFIDSETMPGRVVRVAGQSGLWRVQSWQWRGDGAMLTLARHEGGDGAAPVLNEQPGRIVVPEDIVAGPSMLRVLDVPPYPGQAGGGPSVTLAVSGVSASWRGASIYRVDAGGDLIETGLSVRQTATVGAAQTILPSASALATDTANHVDVLLQHDDMALTGASFAQMANGANLAALGREVIQFAHVALVGDRLYRLTGLWRGRGGTEYAVAGHEAGEDFVLLDDNAIRVESDPGAAARFAAIGPGDGEPVVAAAPSAIRSVQPFSPVYLCATWSGPEALTLTWVRRSRDGYAWRDQVDVPLAEESESYALEISAGGNLLLSAHSKVASYALDAAFITGARARDVPELIVTVRQNGRYGLSEPAELHVAL